jgi:hypothetical protein
MRVHPQDTLDAALPIWYLYKNAYKYEDEKDY